MIQAARRACCCGASGWGARPSLTLSKSLPSLTLGPLGPARLLCVCMRGRGAGGAGPRLPTWEKRPLSRKLFLKASTLVRSTHHDFVAPTLCFSPIVTVTGGCLPKPPRRGGWEWHPRVTPAGSKCCCPRSPSLLPDPLFCAAQAAFCLHGLGALSLCLFLPRHPCTGLSTLPLPPFLHPLVALALSEPVNVYIVLHFVSACLRHVRPAPRVPARPPRGPGSTAPRHSAVQTWSLVQTFPWWS